jgi:hypothetical protein
MVELLCFFVAVLASPFNSRRRLEAENAVLRHQLIILRREVPSQVRLANGDRWFLVQLYRLFPFILQALTIIHPETLVRWDRAGFRGYWRWKSGSRRGGRPRIDSDLRTPIKKMSIENPLRTHSGERRASMVNCSSSGLKSLSPPSPSTWSSEAAHQARGGGRFCKITHRTSPP